MRQPSAILSLAAGIGATTVTLTVRNVLFRKPPPAIHAAGADFARADRDNRTNPIRPIGNPMPAPLYQAWQAALGPAIAGSLSQPQRDVRAGSRTEAVAMRAVTPNLFAVLGVDPIAGQLPTQAATGGARPRC